MYPRMIVAMVTPFGHDGSLDLDGAQELAVHLLDRQACDGIVLNGTTGESPTTTDAEKRDLVRAVVEAVHGRAAVIAGACSYDTAHAAFLAREAECAGADGLLVVAPYYSRPGQEGVFQHISTVADATDLPVTVYDIPSRTGTEITSRTLERLAAHPRITSVKDVAYDFMKSTEVMSVTDLRYYSGADELNLPLYAVGATGVISTVGNVAGREIAALLDAHDSGDTAEATRLHLRLHPLVRSMMGTAPGAVTAKALLAELGLPAGRVRLPLTPASKALTKELTAHLSAVAM